MVCSGTKSAKSATSSPEQPKAEGKKKEVVKSPVAASAANEDDLQIKWDRTRKDVDSNQWDQMFFELSQFKVINGHTNVQPWPSEPRACELSDWCNVQRQHYANLWSDRYSPMTEHQIRQLNQVSEKHFIERPCVCRMSCSRRIIFQPIVYTTTYPRT